MKIVITLYLFLFFYFFLDYSWQEESRAKFQLIAELIFSSWDELFWSNEVLMITKQNEISSVCDLKNDDTTNHKAYGSAARAWKETIA